MADTTVPPFPRVRAHVWRLRSILIVLPFLLHPLVLEGQAGVLEGVVVQDDEGDPVRGARVQLLDPPRSIVTGPDGSFRFQDLSPGSYDLLVEATGFRRVQQEVEVASDMPPVRIPLIPDPLALPEVVGTANPLRGRAPYQPGQAFGPSDLAIRAGESFGEILDGEPGLAQRSFGPATGRPVIRGLDGDRVAVLEGGQRTGDMSETAHDHAIAMEPLLAERVEVVRGPASLLYGSSALGGVVNVLRRDIPTEWSRGVSGRLSAQGTTVNRLVAGAGSAVYGSDRWGATARGSLRRGGDFRAPGSPSGVLECTHTRLATGGAGLGWVGQRAQGGLALDLHDHVYGVPEELDDPDEDVEIRSERQRLTGRGEWDRPARFFDHVEARVAVARFFQQEVEREREADGGFSEEIEHQFERMTLDATVTAMHGAMGPYREGAIGVSVLASHLTASGEEEFHPDGRDLSLAAFTFQEAPLTEALALQMGLRLEHGRTLGSENQAFPGFTGRRAATTFSGALGVRAEPMEALEVGAQLARAHRTPRLDQLYAQGPHLGAGRYEIGEAELENEVGHGFDLFGRYSTERMRGELALFHNRIDHYVFPRRTGEVHEASGLAVVAWSAESASFAGGEAVLDALLSDRLQVRLTGDYVRAVQRDEARTPLSFIPPARASLRAAYDPGGWWAGARARAAAEQDRVPPHQEPTEGYVLVDLQAGLRTGSDGEHIVALRVDNVLDTVYRDHLSRVEERRFPMPGRSLSVVYHWSY